MERLAFARHLACRGLHIHAIYMPRTIQIRKVPDKLYRELRNRATLAGISLSDFLLAELKKSATQPTLREFCGRLHSRTPVSALLDTARLVREQRDLR